VTFSGSYDLGYLLKLLTSGRPLPRDFSAFDTALSAFCPRRHELREELPHGSLESLARKHGLQRHGKPHTAGSDALLTLELFLGIVGAPKSLGAGARGGDIRWNSWGVEDSWETQAYYQAWEQGWDPTRWDNSAWGFPFPGAAWNMSPWLSPLAALSTSPVPSLGGGSTPNAAASFWSTGQAGATKAHMDAAAAARKMGWWMPDPTKVMEI
jgi:hypothetical protein